jgi:protein-L-isoaspartate(D-aspartate) O-methyltransferase
MHTFEPFQQGLLKTIKNSSRKPLPADIEQAFLSTPRHLFIHKYYEPNGKGWNLVEVNDDNLALKLQQLYHDAPLTLVVDEENTVPSTISQPSFVLYMLDKLELREGHSVLEIGAASGWNAAMMGRLVGPGGRVDSVEIIPELATSAEATIVSQGMDHVHIIAGDGGDGYAPGAPYDRIVFTVGSYDIPLAFYDQLKDDGLLLMALKNKGYGDNLVLFKKVDGHFESIDNSACAFVSLRGKYQMNELKAIEISSIPFWQDIKDQIIGKQPFWCGGKSQNNQYFLWKAMGLISFLSITEPSFEAFKLQTDASDGADRRYYFGVVDAPSQSIAIINDEDWLIGYGNSVALVRLKRNIRLWQDAGMPGTSCFGVQAYPIEVRLEPARDEWITRRKDSQFVWSLPGS